MRRVKTDLGAYLQLTGAMALVGSSVVAGKLMAESLPVFLAGGLSSAIGASVLLPFQLRREGGVPALAGRDLLVLFLQAFTGIFLFRVLLLWGLLFTSAVEGGVITSTTPAVVGAISFLFLGERLGPRVATGIVLSVLGIAVLNVLGSGAGASRGPAPLLGNLLVFGAVVSEALFTIFGKAASERVSPLATAVSASVLSLALFLPLGLYQAVGFDFSSVGFAGWASVVHYGVFVTALGYLLWFGGLAKVPASTAGVFTGVLPVSAVVLSYVVLGEPFSWAHPLGMACVLAAILLIARHEPRTVAETEPPA
jgi:drug/metabolite transporter (DMT)-like permease